MLFLLATSEYNNVQLNTTKVRVHLRNGVAEIFNQHQDLMGKVENNLVEIETNFENKIERFSFILQDAVFIVSNQGLEGTLDYKGTGVYVYAKKVREVTSNLSVDEISKQYEQKKAELDTQIERLSDTQDNKALN
jgi:F0F1-type ATP synthase epsilon subunit